MDVNYWYHYVEIIGGKFVLELSTFVLFSLFILIGFRENQKYIKHERIHYIYDPSSNTVRPKNVRPQQNPRESSQNLIENSNESLAILNGQIIARRLYEAVFHTAIYIGDGRIVHMSKEGGTDNETLVREGNFHEHFLKGRTEFFVVRLETDALRTPEQIVEIAMNNAQNTNQVRYDLLRNNCQHFATLCAIGTTYVIEKTATRCCIAIMVVVTLVVGYATHFVSNLLVHVMLEDLEYVMYVLFELGGTVLFVVIALSLASCKYGDLDIGWTTVFISFAWIVGIHIAIFALDLFFSWLLSFYYPYNIIQNLLEWLTENHNKMHFHI